MRQSTTEMRMHTFPRSAALRNQRVPPDPKRSFRRRSVGNHAQLDEIYLFVLQKKISHFNDDEADEEAYYAVAPIGP